MRANSVRIHVSAGRFTDENVRITDGWRLGGDALAVDYDTWREDSALRLYRMANASYGDTAATVHAGARLSSREQTHLEFATCHAGAGAMGRNLRHTRHLYSRCFDSGTDGEQQRGVACPAFADLGTLCVC